MHWFVEPRLRHLVAETLGVDFAELTPDVSLTDDLAADSLDFAELAVRLESEFGMAVPDRIIETIGTYGDLVRATTALLGSRAGGELVHPLRVRARLVTARGELVRAELLTPYVAETISTDALSAGRGARLQLTLIAGPDDAALRRVRDQFAWLAERGVDVAVEREDAVDTTSSAAA